MITRFDPTAHPQNRSLSEILDLTVLVPKITELPGSTIVTSSVLSFTLEQKLCLILRDPSDSGTLVKWWAIGFHDFYSHRRAVNESDKEIRGIQLKILDDTVLRTLVSL